MIHTAVLAFDSRIDESALRGSSLGIKSSGGYYNICRRGALYNGSPIQIKSWPTYSSPRLKQNLVQINPSDFTSYREFRVFLGRAFPDIEPKKTLVRRLDLAVDLSIHLGYFRSSAYVERKKYSNHYETDSRTLVFGKSPQRLHIYDRAHKIKLPRGTILTRIEVQLYGDKLPIKTLAEIENLLTYSPFEILKFRECNFNWDAVRSKRDETNLRVLRDSIQELGFNDARKLLNEYGHFETRYAKLLNKPSEPPPLREMFQRNLRIWLFGEEA